MANIRTLAASLALFSSLPLLSRVALANTVPFTGGAFDCATTATPCPITLPQNATGAFATAYIHLDCKRKEFYIAFTSLGGSYQQSFDLSDTCTPGPEPLHVINIDSASENDTINGQATLSTAPDGNLYDLTVTLTKSGAEKITVTTQLKSLAATEHLCAISICGGNALARKRHRSS